MGQTQGQEQEKAEFVRAAEAMYEELRVWRGQHLDASLDEIAAQVTPRRRALMGQLLKQMAQTKVQVPKDETEVVRQAVGYFLYYRHRMDYAAYRQVGLPIGIGTIESACKTVVQARMKQAGMRWSRDGAKAMLALRCLLLKDRWHELAAPP